MKIGLKTCLSVSLLLILIACAYSIDVFEIKNILRLQPLTLCVSGIMSLVLWGISFRLLGRSRPSNFFLGLNKDEIISSGKIVLLKIKKIELYFAENRGDSAYDLPIFLQKILLFPIFFILTICLVDSRSLVLISELPKMMEPSSNQFCPDEQEEELVQDSIPPGCELVVRAYKLGYSKSLGNCESKAEKEGKQEICRLRQRDEPLLHFTYRQLADVWVNASIWMSDNYLEKEIESFQRKTQNVESLIAAQKHSMISTPHSIHYIFTNLSEPPRSLKEKFRKLTESNYCLQEYSDLPHTLPDQLDKDEVAGSRELEFSYGHLLFNDRHQKSAGFCREFAIVWDMPEVSCLELARQPQAFLEKNNLTAEVESVIERRSSLEYMASETELSKLKDLSRVVSFQCINFTNNQKGVSSQTFVLDGQKLETAQVSLVHETESTEKILPKTVILGLAQSLAPHFNYSPYYSNQQLNGTSAEELSLMFSTENDMLLSRLELLRKADIMLGHEWLHDEPELLEIYPWHLHLYNFVGSFRKEYRNIRGRL